MENSPTASELVQIEIDFWINTFPSYKSYFEIEIIKSFLKICVIVSQPLPIKEKIITDFIEGLVLLRIYLKNPDEGYGKKIDSLINPVFELLENRIGMDNYQKMLIETKILGNAKLQYKNDRGRIIEIPIAEALLQFIKQLKVKPLIPNDITPVISQFIYSQDQIFQVENNSNIIPNPSKLKCKQIALIYIYSNCPITRKNADIIAAENSHRSGEALYHDFTHFSSRDNRINLEDTRIKTKNKIELIESIIPFLKDEPHKKWATDELSILISKEKQYLP